MSLNYKEINNLLIDEEMSYSNDDYTDMEITSVITKIKCKLCKEMIQTNQIIELYDNVFICQDCINCINSIS